MKKCVHRTWIPTLPDKVNRGHNPGNIKGILTQLELDLCIVDKTLYKSLNTFDQRKLSKLEQLN